MVSLATSVQKLERFYNLISTHFLFQALFRVSVGRRTPEGAVAQSVRRATLGEEVPGSIPAVAARSLQAGSVSV